MTTVKSFTFNPFQENTYIVYDEEKNAIIFDPGCYTLNERKMLQKFIADNELIIKRLINTHCHLDHIFGNVWVGETYGVELECHQLELPVLARAPISGDMFGVPTPPQPTPSVFIEENDVIEVGSMRFRAIFAPGHSPGSLCFYSETDKILIAGDVLFFESIGRSDLPGGNQKTLLQSIAEKLYVLPDETVVYSGHGMKTQIGWEKKNNPFVRG